MSGRSFTLGVLTALTLALVAHALLMASNQGRHSPAVINGALIAALMAHPHHTDPGPADLDPDLATTPDQDRGATCGAIAPWVGTGDAAGKRLDLGMPLAVEASAISGAGPTPHARTQLDPPDVRRAFLQVYRN